MIKYIKAKEEFQNEIKSGIVVVDFFATWCNPCQRLGQVLEKIAGEDNPLRIIKVDVDQFQELAMEYNVESIPQINILKDGNEVYSFLGSKGSDELNEIFTKYCK